MNTEIPTVPFTPSHHGLLMAWLARQACQRVGPLKGEMVTRKAIRRYGEERGRRMAQRALADKKELNTLTYMLYGEWSAAPGEVEQRLEANNHNNMRLLVERCPWHQVWLDHDLIEFGRIYCQEIDLALLRGFNPDLHLDVVKTQTNDRQPCDFIFHGTPLNTANSIALKVGKKVSPGKRVLLPWEFHVGHLFKTFNDVFLAELGLVGREAAEAALNEFAQRFGEQAGRLVRSYLQNDFTRVPDSAILKMEATHGYS